MIAFRYLGPGLLASAIFSSSSAIAAPPPGPASAYLQRCVGGLPWEPSLGFNLETWLKSDAKSGIRASWTKIPDGWLLSEHAVDQLTQKPTVLRYQLATEGGDGSVDPQAQSGKPYCDSNSSKKVFLRAISVNGTVLTSDQVRAQIVQSFANLVGVDRQPKNDDSRPPASTLPPEPEVLLTEEMVKLALYDPAVHPVWLNTNSIIVCYSKIIRIKNGTPTPLHLHLLHNSYTNEGPPKAGWDFGIVQPGAFVRWQSTTYGTDFIGVYSSQIGADGNYIPVKIYRLFSPADCPATSGRTLDPHNRFDIPSD